MEHPSIVMTNVIPTQPVRTLLETFENPYPNRRYHILTRCPEFTSVCPKTGLPDFGTIVFDYVPDQRCIELKSLKYYLLGYRNTGAFYERVVNQILEDLVAVCDPYQIEVRGEFTARGGIQTTICVAHEKS